MLWTPLLCAKKGWKQLQVPMKFLQGRPDRSKFNISAPWWPGCAAGPAARWGSRFMTASPHRKYIRSRNKLTIFMGAARLCWVGMAQSNGTNWLPAIDYPVLQNVGRFNEKEQMFFSSSICFCVFPIAGQFSFIFMVLRMSLFVWFEHSKMPK